MYEIDELDTVVELTDVPDQCPGAPSPIVIADGYECLLSYLLHESGSALIRFHHAWLHALGGPNDEAISGHPLYARGLDSYGAYEVQHSSLIRGMERMNSVHPSHNPKRFENLRHFIFTFHDDTFECVAESFESEVSADEEGRFERMIARFR